MTWIGSVLRPLLTCAVVALTLLTTAHGSATRGTPTAGASTAIARFLPGDPDQGDGPGIHSGEAQRDFQRAFPARSVPLHGYTDGMRQAERDAQTAPGWRELGPRGVPAGNFASPRNGARSTVAGRITAIAVDPASCSGDVCSTIYAGGAAGGVWKSLDAGRSWIPLLDNQPNLHIGALTLDPVNPQIVYAGTGDPSHAGGAQGGIGILRSTDGGLTWTVLGANVFANEAVTSIVVDPRTAGSTSARLYASTTSAQSGSATTGGGSFTNNPALPLRGVYVSPDGGQRWALSTPLRDQNFGVETLLLDPRNPEILYAGFDDDGVFESLDAGGTWQPLNRGLPKPFSFFQVKLAISASDPRVFYAGFDVFSKHGEKEEIFRSGDGGASWTQLKTAPNACGTQCFDNLVLTVDPTNPDTIYGGGTANYTYLDHTGKDNGRGCLDLSHLPAGCDVTIMKSVDGGAHWSDSGENGAGAPLHPDDHAILIDPKNPRVLYAGLDGGLFHSADAGATWDALNTGLGTIETQALSVSPTGDVFIGTQDNGTMVYRRGLNSWFHILDGDGGNTAVDPSRPSTSYQQHFGASLLRNDSSGGAYHGIYIDPFYPDYSLLNRGNFYEPYAIAPTRPNDLYYGTFRVWRSKMRGGVDGNHDGVTFNDKHDREDWTPISFDLSCAQEPKKPSGQCDSRSNNHQGISAVAVSPANPSVVVAASSNGHLWLTTNALARVKTDASCDPRRHRDLVPRCNFVSGVHWKRIDAHLPQRFPTSIAFYPHSSTSFLVTYSGFDENTKSSPGHLFRTTNDGRTWSNLTGSLPGQMLPDLPFNDALVNPRNGHLYAAADYGLYLSTDNGVTWSRFDGGLPAAPVYQLAFWAQTGGIDVATYGRGVWETAAP